MKFHRWQCLKSVCWNMVRTPHSHVTWREIQFKEQYWKEFLGTKMGFCWKVSETLTQIRQSIPLGLSFLIIMVLDLEMEETTPAFWKWRSAISECTMCLMVEGKCTVDPDGGLVLDCDYSHLPSFSPASWTFHRRDVRPSMTEIPYWWRKVCLESV